ncbi:bifunctional DNA primase/polymerase [Actinoplanes sp. TRM 88003]|uniref:Bifunctional DNA primase/polymerase n=1 Tax=Paractinoplanes aksuensis TaxID=2939490 RepID=A0ABT1DVB9_9ACTN|nr:bifunctional DNA primase/polymerase [Actinoplanes aksuensis]MCO8274803.1 bifunctional DNA primase/polymerase [Actinoplanes aksuensis]
MQWTGHRPFVPSAALDRLRLRRAALRYAERGWTVTRGARSVLLATGHRFDALEVPAELGLRTLGAVRLNRRADAHGPVAVTAAGRWLFLVTPGLPLRPTLDHRLDVVRHGVGSWIAAPPSRMPEGPVRWAVPPERTQWRLPGADVVQGLLADALGTRPGPALTVPRQMSTARRGA